MRTVIARWAGAVSGASAVPPTNTRGAFSSGRISCTGEGWGLVSAVVREPGLGCELMSAGTLHWSGAATTTFFADPQEQLVAVLFAQHLPYDECKLTNRFRTAVYQALR
jgi:CubicO group peptidase (beta-lactamase class C family)